MVGEIEAMRSRVAAADGLAGFLEAAWDAFLLAESVCWACEARTGELFAAFMFASVAAAEARMALVSAPSLSAGPGALVSGVAAVPDDVEAAADAVAALARLLERRLTAAGSEAADPGDRKAYQEAAAGARRIVRLLARGEP